MLHITIDGKEQEAVNNIVIYDDHGNAIAAVVDIGGGIMFADAARDIEDLNNILQSIGESGVVHKAEAGPMIVGSL